jgi:hypothetical protein
LQTGILKTQGSCPDCNEGCEDIKHLMFLCKRADIWQKIDVWHEMQKYIAVDRSGSVAVRTDFFYT